MIKRLFRGSVKNTFNFELMHLIRESVTKIFNLAHGQFIWLCNEKSLATYFEFFIPEQFEAIVCGIWKLSFCNSHLGRIFLIPRFWSHSEPALKPLRYHFRQTELSFNVDFLKSTNKKGYFKTRPKNKGVLIRLAYPALQQL